MKKIRHISSFIIITASILFTQKVFSQTDATSTCEALKQTSNFTADQEPSLKKLKKMVGKDSNDKVLDYAIYLHDFLMPQNIKYYDDFQRASTGESYPNQKAIEEKQMAVVKEYILPMASAGDLKAISFLSGKGYWRISQALRFISKCTSNNSAVKFATYQLNFQSGDGSELKVKYTNKYILSEDSLLKSYFTAFDKSDLIRLRGAFDNKIAEIIKIKEHFRLSTYDYENLVDERNSALEKLPAAIDDKTFCLSFTFSSITGSGMLSIVVSTPKNQTGFKLEKTLNLIQYEKVKIHRSPNCKSLERGRERSLS